MRSFLFVLLAVALVIVAALIAAPMFISTQTFREPIETAATQAIGRDVSLGEDLSLTLFPQAAFKASNLTVANPEGFEGPPLASIAKADIGVKIAALLKRDIEISRFVLVEPELTLIRAADGRANWEIAAAPGAEPRAENTGDAEPNVNDIRLGDVRIVNGSATYTDHTTDSRFQASDINLAAQLSSLADPMTLSGDLVFQGAPAKADIVITTPAALLDQEPANVKLDLKLAESTVAADLNVIAADALSYTGAVNIDAPNLPQLAEILGAQLEDAPGFDRLALEGTAEGGASAALLEIRSLTFDAVKAVGDLRLDWSGPRPKASGSLSTDQLDLRPYMPPPAQDAEGFPAWSDQEIDFKSLRNLDSDLSVSAGGVLLNGLTLGKTDMKVRIDRGRLVANLTNMALYDGLGSGQLVVNARGASPSFAGNFTLDDVNAQPFAIEAMKLDRLLGIGAMNLKFTASGSSQAAIMRSLDGDGGFDLQDGALKGVNIGKLVGAVASLEGGFNPNAIVSAVTTARQPYETTDFSQFFSRFTMKNGIVTTPTISLQAPFLDMNGSGQINLPNQTLDLLMTPKARRSENDRVYSVPLRITGSFADPQIGVDVESLARDRLRQGLGNALSGALGGRANDGADGDRLQPPNPADILRGVLTRPRQSDTTADPDGETEAGKGAQNQRR